jgi:acetyl-CoA acetyltransferase
MRDVFVIGVTSTAFGKKIDVTFKELTRQTYLRVLADLGWQNGDHIDFAYFGNCAMHGAKQGTIRGQACTIELVDEGLFPANVPIINVEGACATGSMALHSAVKDIRSGSSQCVLAIGVEKLFLPKAAKDPEAKKRMIRGFLNGVDNFDLDRLFATYEQASASIGLDFGIDPGRSFFMGAYATQAALHMKEFGTTQEQLAIIASKSHEYGALNELAQYRFEMTPEDVLADREVAYPLTRAMCAPIGDGGAAAMVCSEDFLETLPTAQQARAVRVLATTLTGGRYRPEHAASAVEVAAGRAFQEAGIDRSDVDVLEVHDATAFGEISSLEAMGFCAPGEGGPFAASGATGPGGSLPVNTSGGLISKGHPVGATGLSMVHELVTQLRGEAGTRQVPAARIGLQQNAGGMIGMDEAASSVMILETAR